MIIIVAILNSEGGLRCYLPILLLHQLTAGTLRCNSPSLPLYNDGNCKSTRIKSKQLKLTVVEVIFRFYSCSNLPLARWPPEVQFPILPFLYLWRGRDRNYKSTRINSRQHKSTQINSFRSTQENCTDLPLVRRRRPLEVQFPIPFLYSWRLNL